MKKTFAILLILLSSSFLVAQELMEVPLSGIDSMKQISPATDAWMMSPNLSYPMIGNPSDFILSSGIRDFDFSKYLVKNRKVLSFQLDNQASLFSPVVMPVLSPYAPWLHSSAILNQAAYSISDKLVLGGNSFGLNSIHSAPLPVFDQQQWDIRGASMFMQYKVNRNFTIETRVSVTGNRFQP